MRTDILKIISESGALVENDHFVYKGKEHGPAYLNKELFSFIGARTIMKLVNDVARNAFNEGIDFGGEKTIGVIGPAYGAISLALPLAAAFEEIFPDISFFPARTEITIGDNGDKIHAIPDKFKIYYERINFIIIEDIVNKGATIREIKELFEDEMKVKIIAALCIADRGGQTAETLGIGQYFPYFRINMEKYEAMNCPLCRAGVPINIMLGKGRRWVKIFGQPPYKEGTDFSLF